MLSAEEKKKEEKKPEEEQKTTEAKSGDATGSDAESTASDAPSTEDQVMMENPHYPAVPHPSDEDVIAYLRYLTARVLSPTEQEIARQSFPRIFND